MADKEEKKEKKERKERKKERKEGEDGEKKERKERKERKKKDGEDGERKKKKKKRDGEDGERKKKKRDGEDGERRKKKEGEEGGEKKKKRERRNRDIFEVYDIGEELGRGAFSVVKMAVCKKDGSKWAVKIIDKKSAGQDMDRLETEIEILKKVTHPNIICLKDIYDTKSMFYIVTELVTGGELFDKIVEVGNYTEKDAAILVEKMLSAIGYLHSMGIVHRDLKPENLLLKDGSNITEITLADFGLSKIVGQKVMMQTACGTPGYVAPEVLQAQGYGPEVDLWSIGVITYILLCGFPPFYHENLPDLFEQIISADFDFPEEYWDSVSNEGKDFIKKLLVVKPSERMNVEHSMEHPWIKSQGGGAAQGQIKPTFAEEMKKYTATRRQQSKVNAAS